jgi:type II secretory pathway pseudopilin PulG
MVVIAIMGIIFGISVPSFSLMRAKGNDDKRRADMRRLTIAISLYYQQFHKMPDDFNCADISDPNNVVHYDCNGVPGSYGACDAPLPESPGGDSTMLAPDAYNKSMQELVDAGFLQNIPHSPGGPGYCYAPLGDGSSMVVTELLSAPASNTGEPPSVRPYTGVTWCTNDRSDHEYCFEMKN